MTHNHRVNRDTVRQVRDAAIVASDFIVLTACSRLLASRNYQTMQSRRDWHFVRGIAESAI